MNVTPGGMRWRPEATQQLGHTQHDPALRPAAESGITYFPDVVADLRPPMLVLVRGPRRVGKSVAAKRYIQQLFIDGGAEQARRTIYFATDGWRAQDLRRAFTVSCSR